LGDIYWPVNNNLSWEDTDIFRRFNVTVLKGVTKKEDSIQNKQTIHWRQK